MTRTGSTPGKRPTQGLGGDSYPRRSTVVVGPCPPVSLGGPRPPPSTHTSVKVFVRGVDSVLES